MRMKRAKHAKIRMDLWDCGSEAEQSQLIINREEKKGLRERSGAIPAYRGEKKALLVLAQLALRHIETLKKHI